MGRLVKISHPHHLDKINNVSKLLLTYKNILIEMYHKGYVEKIDGVCLPVRWCLTRNYFVIDREEKNYIKGIDFTNIESAFLNRQALLEGGNLLLKNINTEEFIKFSKQFNLMKNENRFLFFEYVNKKTNIVKYDSEKIFLVGLYQKKKDYIPLETSSLFIKNYSRNFSFISDINSGKLKTSYHDIYNDFIELLKKEKLNILINDNHVNLNLNNFIKNNRSFNNFYKIKNKKIKDTSINLYRDILKNKSVLSLKDFNMIKDGFLATHLNTIFGTYIKNILNVNGEGIIINTGFFLKNNVKLTGDFITKNEESNFFLSKDLDNKSNYAPLLPFKF